MTNTSISLQELRRKIYIKAKAEKHWKFWGLYSYYWGHFSMLDK